MAFKNVPKAVRANLAPVRRSPVQARRAGGSKVQIHTAIRGDQAVAWMVLPLKVGGTIKLIARMPLAKVRELCRRFAARQVSVGAVGDESGFFKKLFKGAKKLAKKLMKSKLVKGGWNLIKQAGPFLPSPINQTIATMDTAEKIATMAAKARRMAKQGKKLAAPMLKALKVTELAKKAKAQTRVRSAPTPRGRVPAIRAKDVPLPRGVKPGSKEGNVFRAVVTLLQ